MPMFAQSLAPTLTDDPVATVPTFALRAQTVAHPAVEGATQAARLRQLVDNVDQAPDEGGARRVLRAAVRSLPQAVHEVDLSNVGEFHALFQLMLGLGLDSAALAARLEVGIATIGRYASGTSAPATVHARRGALIETVSMIEQRLRGGELQCLTHLHRD